MIDEHAFYLRHPDLVAIGTANRYLFVDPRGKTFDLATAFVPQWSALLEALMDPLPGQRVCAHLSQLSETDVRSAERLLEAGLLLGGADAVSLRGERDRLLTDNRAFHFERGEPRCEHLVVAMTGSIVAGLTAPVILSLAYSGFQRQLDLLLTPTTLRFTTRDFFESYGIRTWVDPFERRDGIHVAHVGLGAAADCLLVLPASAHALHRIAETACTDLLSMTVAATRAPVILAPVMNTVMWNNPGVQRHVQRLREDGRYVIEPTIIVKAAALVEQGEPMYGGPGTFWRGPLGVMQCVSAVLDHHARRLAAGV